MTVRGVVHMVGAGPGDPQLLTRRAARLLGAADVVVTDRPAADEVAALAPPTARRCYVGEAVDDPAWPLARIVDLLASHAGRGRQVVRLEAGDLFIGSRAAEEVEALRARGVTVTTTPGVSAATAAALASGTVPVPGTTVTIARDDDDPDAVPVDWDALAEVGATLVAFADGARHHEIAERLLAAGAGAATPVALVRDPTQPGTQVAHTDLHGLGATQASPPATLVIGPVRRGARPHR